MLRPGRAVDHHGVEEGLRVPDRGDIGDLVLGVVAGEADLQLRRTGELLGSCTGVPATFRPSKKARLSG